MSVVRKVIDDLRFHLIRDETVLTKIKIIPFSVNSCITNHPAHWPPHGSSWRSHCPPHLIRSRRLATDGLAAGWAVASNPESGWQVAEGPPWCRASRVCCCCCCPRRRPLQHLSLSRISSHVNSPATARSRRQRHKSPPLSHAVPL